MKQSVMICCLSALVIINVHLLRKVPLCSTHYRCTGRRIPANASYWACVTGSRPGFEEDHEAHTPAL